MSGTAIGTNAQANTSATAIGADAVASGGNSIAAGAGSLAANTNSIAIGTSTTSRGRGAIAFGERSSADGLAAAAFGQRAVATGENALAIGTAAQATANSVALGAGSIAKIGARSSYTGYNLTGTQSSMGEVNIGNRTISGVAPGLNDDEAVNVAQLKGVTAKVDEVATTVDGAVKYDRNPDGTVNKNSVTLEGDPAAGGTAIHNVAAGVNVTDAVNLGQLNDAIGQVNNAVINAANPFFSAEGERDTEGASVTGTHAVAAGASASASGTDAAAFGARASASGAGAAAFGAGASASGAGALAAGQNAAASGNGATALGNGAQASADNSVALGQNSAADRANSVSVGTAGHERQITNVAAGTQGTDAVNVDQLSQSSSNTLKQANDYANSKAESTRRDAYAGTAAALAVAGLPQAVLPGRGMVAIGGGTYGGQSAVALGVSQLSDNGIWAYKVTGTTSTRGEFGVSLGAGMHW
ncbi:YadA family autotransporter adhesin [Caballeronia terrestris]|jgi:autotransporter adhesin|nr:YadA-like family protein [Caballeronia terrestris]